MADFAVLLGLAAGALTTLCNVPQLLRSWKTKSTHDISLVWLVMLASGVLLWLVYGLLIDSLPVILANTFTFVLVAGIIVLKLSYG
ncbi:MAG: SemiSWEET transporter [archaeon]|nr:SemiSWEET transporter [archaeon]